MSISIRSLLRSAVPTMVLGAALCLHVAGAAAQTVTNGDSTFTIDPSATFASTNGATVRTGTVGGSTANLTVGGNATDNLFQQWWWFRVNGLNTREFALSGRTGGTVAGDTITLNYTEIDGFTAELKYILTDGPNTPVSACNVGMSCRITNTGAAPLSIAVFGYVDFDLQGFATDSAILLSPGLIEATDQSTGLKGQYLGIAPDAFQVNAFSALRALLADTSITDLNNTGLPFAAADFTSAYQWNLTIPAGGSQLIRGAIAINQTAVAPPGGPTCPADYNSVGGITVQDIFDFLSDWFSNLPRADFNGAGGITVQDVFDFLTAWFNGCP
jgi:hypothetical protein